MPHPEALRAVNGFRALAVGRAKAVAQPSSWGGGTTLPSYLPAYSQSERPVKHPGEGLPRELAHLRKARPSLSALEPILDIEDRGRILLAQSEPMGRLGL
jgi:hypothetical protein